MITQPIQMFENLTSETTPAGRNDIAKVGFSVGDRQMIELRARYARAELMANALGDTLLWLGRCYDRLVAAIKADFKLRAAEAQLLRMTDRELADLGLARGDMRGRDKYPRSVATLDRAKVDPAFQQLAQRVEIQRVGLIG